MRTALALAVLLGFSSLGIAADDTYEIKQTDATAALGARTTATVTITSRKGWHLNHEAPLTLKLTPVPGVVFDKPKLGRADLARSTDDEARFDVGLTLSEPGKKLIDAEAGFVLCQEEACRPIKRKLTLAAEATAPAPAKTTPPARKAKQKP